jgi:tripartite-type tricarboxylate transporter receptor subunit TctC
MTTRRTPITRRSLLGSAAASAFLSAAPAIAQSGWPDRPIKLIVPYPAGGSTDVLFRILAERMKDKLGQPFVVENRPSASGNTGAEAVFHSAADGYMLLASSGSPLAINGWLYKKLNYEPERFEPIAVMSRIPNVLAVRNDFPARSPQEFIAYTRANPGKVSYASQGVGTASHLTAELFMKLTGARLLHVPYKGTSPALNDIVAGHVDSSFISLSSALELAQGGKLRLLGIATEKRIDALPDIPTLAEAGHPELVTSTWNALSAPPGTPAAIVARLNAAVNETLQDAHVQSRFRELQLTAASGGPAETKAMIAKERRQWGEVVQAAGIQPE